MRRVANVALGLALLLTGCEKSSAPEETIARVGDIALTEADLEAKLPLGIDPESVDGERARLVDAWVQQELLYQEALRRDLHREARLQTLLERARRDLLIAALLDAEFAGQETVIDEEAIAAYYRERAGDFQRPLPEIRARHILLVSQRDANAKRRILQQNTPFEQVAADHSIDPDTRFQGGIWATFPRTWIRSSGRPVRICRSTRCRSRSAPNTATTWSRCWIARRPARCAIWRRCGNRSSKDWSGSGTRNSLIA